MSEGFLSRWSRRKHEVRRVERSGSSPPEDAAAPVRDTSRQSAEGAEPSAPEAALTAAELAELPKLDELTAATDITGFLRRGVPEQLRNAALRKVWMLDPAIRDFVGHARDYAYDWNAPDGVPGNGAIEPADQIAAVVRSVLDEPGTTPAARSAAEPTGKDGSAGRPRDDHAPAAVQDELAGEDGRGASVADSNA
jgi:hypothetical protein